MTQASKREDAKLLILGTLAKSPEGLRANDLFKLCKQKIGSRQTLWKYVDEMEDTDHTVTRTIDPKDERAVIIKANSPEAKAELLFLEVIQQIRKLSSSSQSSQKKIVDLSVILQYYVEGLRELKPLPTWEELAARAKTRDSETKTGD